MWAFRTKTKGSKVTLYCIFKRKLSKKRERPVHLGGSNFFRVIIQMSFKIEDWNSGQGQSSMCEKKEWIKL